MAYVCELGSGQRVYLDNQGTQTVVTTVSSTPGQQQQASSGFPTGAWISPPSVFRTPQGAVLLITTAQGEHFIQIQGTSMMVVSGAGTQAQQLQVQTTSDMPSSSIPPMQPMTPMAAPETGMPSMQPMQPMQPIPSMQPMQPMNLTMGNMQMQSNPMEMRMGNMEMRMGNSTPNPRKFCSQCGSPVSASDRFCASCGHQLT